MRSHPAGCYRRQCRAGRSALAVDERELTEPASTLVDPGEATQRLCVLVGIDLDRNAIFKANSEPADDRPVIEDERLRRGDVPARATGVRRREDLLAREVQEMPQALRGQIGRASCRERV